jgi:hypothetical protein
MRIGLVETREREGVMKRVSLAAILAVVIAILLAAAFGRFGGTSHAVAAKAGAPAANGVTIHGQWTLQVRASSGRVLRTYRFHNDLFNPFGAGELTNHLKGSFSNGPWQVLLAGSPQPCAVSGGATSCGISEVGAEPAGFQGDNTYNLTKSSIANGFRLQGSVIVDAAGTITSVQTYLSHCVSSTAPADCHGENGWSRVTQRVLGSSVSVSAGQQVLATVDITFS